MEEWADLKTADERLDAVQVPEAILKKMTDRALVISYINNPLMFEIFLGNNIQNSFDILSGYLNTIKEVQVRDSIGYSVIEVYKKMDLLSNNTIFKRDYRPRYTEILLAQDSILSDLTLAQLTELQNISFSKINLKLSNTTYFGRISVCSTARILAKILILQNKRNELDSVVSDRQLDHFLTKGGSCSDELLNKIIILSHQ